MSSARTYLIVSLIVLLLAGCVDPIVPPSEEPAFIELSTDIAHVEVFLDGVRVGETDRNGQLSIETEAGTRTLLLEKQGFEPFERSLTLFEGPQEHSFTLERGSFAPSFTSYVWVGEPGRQFNDAEFSGIAAYDLFVIEKFHALWDYLVHQDAAREAKQRNPDQIVLPYLAPKYRFLNDQFGTETFKDDWLLYDLNGDPIPFVPAQNLDTGIAIANYTDFSNPEYRQWVVDLVLEWNEAAPYDGIAFDHMTRFAYEFNRPAWDARLGSEKVDAWNEGLLLLIEETKSALGPDKVVLYNGISRRDRTDDRNFEQLEFSDGALNEVFCVGHGLRRGEIPNVWSVQELIEDIELQLTFTDRTLLQKTNYDRTVTGDARDELSRFCLGLFAMGHVPGQTHYKYGHGYNARFEEITANAQGIDVAFGAPISDYVFENGILMREYKGGIIFVNPASPDDEGLTEASMRTPADVRILYDSEGRRFFRGDSIIVEPQQALFAERI
jgi:hypothetical protein